jgi:hypothetical protein
MIPGWLEEITGEVSRCLAVHGCLSARELAVKLGVSERTAIEYIGLLAARGHVTIDGVSLVATPAMIGAGPAAQYRRRCS